jgi:hypothetical protein
MRWSTVSPFMPFIFIPVASPCANAGATGIEMTSASRAGSRIFDRVKVSSCANIIAADRITAECGGLFRGKRGGRNQKRGCLCAIRLW